MKIKPDLFGLKYSNKNFEREESWGKNQFNNTFPIALICYMSSKNIKPVYLKSDSNFKIKKEYISAEELFGKNPITEEIYYSFETKFENYDQYGIGEVPRIDLITKDKATMKDLKPLEIKLTTLPDSTTCNLSEEEYGSELVVRPDTIVYQAYSIADSFSGKRDQLFENLSKVYNKINDWNNQDQVKENYSDVVKTIIKLINENYHLQKPLLIQPIWKTIGKTPKLSENCLDIFIWSNFSFTKLFLKETSESIRTIDRNARTVIWLFLMLYDYSLNNQIDHKKIIDTYTYGTRNDKAFAISGNQTNGLMKCDELKKPRIKKEEIKNIILGNGQNYLSPERRLDAVIAMDTLLF